MKSAVSAHTHTDCTNHDVGARATVRMRSLLLTFTCGDLREKHSCHPWMTLTLTLVPQAFAGQCLRQVLRFLRVHGNMSVDLAGFFVSISYIFMYGHIRPSHSSPRCVFMDQRRVKVATYPSKTISMDQSRVSGIWHVTTSIDLLGGVSQFQQGLFGDLKREKSQEDEGSVQRFVLKECLPGSCKPMPGPQLQVHSSLSKPGFI
eukprot:scaffold163018_cov26-Prasinocladus_malaysianus.AAC.1